MKYFLLPLLFAFVAACAQQSAVLPESDTTADKALEDFVWSPEKFADVKIVRTQLPGFERLSLQQKKLVYYLVEAGLAGRDIMWDQNYRHNLSIRRAIEKILSGYSGDRSQDEWAELVLYTKRMFVANGIHHHYSNDKFKPGFSRAYFEGLMQETGAVLYDKALTAMFNPAVDAKKINLDPNSDLILGSAVNFYGPDVTTAEVDEFYDRMIDPDDTTPISYGLNSKLVRNDDDELEEKVWHAEGMYGAAIKKITPWLEKAVSVAENRAQADALQLLIEYYNTGDLETWDEYNIAWVQATDGDVDYIQSFIEVYNDPKGFRGSFENIVQIKDFEASERMQLVANNAQWFEDQSPILPAHKKQEVVGISYNVVNVAGESGDAAPVTPIGVNLPNANWIRAKFGSKSVSLGNIIEAYDNSRGEGLLQEFAHDAKEIELSKAHSTLASKMRTALHEVIGHASGQLEQGVATPKETLKIYSSALEEARADLVALYFMLDPKMLELGLIETLDVAHAAYDGYIRNGMLLQLRRIEPGNNIEQAHMRNRQMVSSWAYEKGLEDNVIEKIQRDGKTYFDIRDYQALRGLFGELLREVQRIKSQGDYAAGRDLIENYGVQVDKALHEEVLARAATLAIPPYSAVINPALIAERDRAGEITDIKVSYPEDFLTQMLRYGREYSFLPDYN